MKEPNDVIASGRLDGTVSLKDGLSGLEFSPPGGPRPLTFVVENTGDTFWRSIFWKPDWEKAEYAEGSPYALIIMSL